MTSSNEHTVMETFRHWFGGEWDNSRQAQMYPNRSAFVHVIHEEVDTNQWRCSYRFHRSKYPYRDFTLTQMYNDGCIILKNGPIQMEWSIVNGNFACSDVTDRNDVTHFYEATLGKNHFFVEDKAWRGETQLWGLEEGVLYEFRPSNLLRGVSVSP